MKFSHKTEIYYYKIDTGICRNEMVEITFIDEKFFGYKYKNSISDPKEDIENINQILKIIERLKMQI